MRTYQREFYKLSFFEEGECYKDWNYLESSRRTMSRNVLFQEFSRTVTHQFQNSL